jgi:methylglutaconyl-CoA hydratase
MTKRMASFSTLNLTHDPRGVLWIKLNRPEVRNAFNEVMISELTHVFQVEALDPKIKICVLMGDGPTFCAGGDLNWMKKSVQFSKEENLLDTTRLVELFRLMNEIPKPLLAGVQGACIGGGVGLVSVCDFVCASQETQFGLSEVRLGLIPACIGPFVISKIGASFARALFLSGERFDAPRAYEIGLIHRLVQKPTDLHSSLEKMIENLLQCAPHAMAAAKKLILDLSWPEKRAENVDCLYYVAEMLADLRVSPEGQEGVKAFLEKRKPNWIE